MTTMGLNTVGLGTGAGMFLVLMKMAAYGLYGLWSKTCWF